MKSLLLTLDIKRRQVLVEAMLLEVGLTDQDRFKTSFIVSGGGKDGGAIAQSYGSDILSLFSNPSGIQDFSIAAASAGTLKLGNGIELPTQSVLLSAIQSNTNVNVLSAPTILATNNEQAEIVVGQNIPFLASTSSNETNLNNTFNQIDRQDVGITLRLTPQISSRDSVTLQIFTEVSSLVATDSTLGPTTTVRTTETSVITKDGQMIVTGGLMADANTDTDAGVPFLKDVPVLGHLFRFSNAERRRTNLLILITPRIVKDQYDARDLTIENRKALEDEIRRRDMNPDRREILHDRAIDRVAESEPFDGPAPSSILPPDDKAINDNQIAANNMENVLEFSINPKIPTKPKFDQKTVKTEGVKNGLSTASGTQHGSLNLPKTDAFIVIELASPKTAKINLEDLPFKLSPKKKLTLIRVPSEARNSVLHLFKSGSEVGYQIAGKSTVFRVLGSFGSAEEASLAFNEVGKQWYEMSPYEIMKIGVEPWVQIH